jgi:hypothetical protein
MTSPPLLMLAAGQQPRLRRAPKIRQKEFVLHLTVADLLRRAAHPDWRWSHFPAGELRDPRVGAKLRAMGPARGWPDFLLFSPVGQLHALELKRVGDTLTDEQSEFAAWCDRAGVSHGVARTFDEAITLLGNWGALRVTPSAPRMRESQNFEPGGRHRMNV